MLILYYMSKPENTKELAIRVKLGNLQLNKSGRNHFWLESKCCTPDAFSEVSSNLLHDCQVLHEDIHKDIKQGATSQKT
jgi:hypothetical protein